MKETLVTIETAKLAKICGFDETCDYGYVETIAHDIVSGHNGNEYHCDYVPPRPMSTRYLREYDSLVVNAPTQSNLQKWLREKHKLYIQISLVEDIKSIIEKFEYVVISIPKQTYVFETNKLLLTYEDALEEGLFSTLRFCNI